MKQRFRKAPRWKLLVGSTTSNHVTVMKTMSGVGIVVQQYNVDKRLDVHQGTPPLKVLRMLFALATSKGSHRQKVCGIWDVSVAFFHSPMDEFTVVRPPVGLRVRGKLWVLKRALYCMALGWPAGVLGNWLVKF